jgi:hypothetical protein
MSFRRKIQRKRGPGGGLATVSYYGPTDKLATKVAVGIVQNGDVRALETWSTEDGSDVRAAPAIRAKTLAFIARHAVTRTVVADRILGCPHEEGIDYAEGESCPQCPFWRGRDRFGEGVT